LIDLIDTESGGEPADAITDNSAFIPWVNTWSDFGRSAVASPNAPPINGSTLIDGAKQIPANKSDQITHDCDDNELTSRYVSGDSRGN